MITYREAKKLLDYDQTTGIFTWKEREIRSEFSRTDKTWNARFAGKIAGTKHSDGYLTIVIFGEHYLAHRVVWLLAMGKWPKEHIDHINGVRDDNRLCNLREATNEQNSYNSKTRSHSTSGIKGVRWKKDKRKWQARIRKSKKEIHLGYFSTSEAAHAAYIKASKGLHGEFANDGQIK